MLAKVLRSTVLSRGSSRQRRRFAIVADGGGGGPRKVDGRYQDLASIFSAKEVKRV